MMLKDANAAEVVSRVKEKVSSIQQSLPEGVVIKPFLDRTDLVQKTTNTISENLLIGGLIVIFFLVLLLGTLRAGIIVASVIPLTMLFALGMMHVFGVSANLMSLGAIDFGIIVDGAVIIIEVMVVMLTKKFTELQKLSSVDRGVATNSIAFQSSSEMMNAAIFGQIIILIVFIPILTLTGIEGKMFRPMALVFGFAILGAMLLCLTYVPMVAASFLYSKKLQKKTWGDRFMQKMEATYLPVLQWALSAKKLVLGIAGLFLIGAIGVFSSLGGEFIPQLDEGDLAIETRMAPGTSLEEMVKNMNKLEAILINNFPEVNTVVTKIGAGEIPTDPMPIEGADIMVDLKEKDEWTSANTKAALVALMEEKLAVLPGVSVEFSQPIEMRFNELMTGVKQDIAVKIYGENLDILQQKGEQAATIIKAINGAADVRVEQVVGLPQIVIDYKRNRMAEYGVAISDVNTLVRTAFAGAAAGKVFEGEKRYDLTVRLKKENRSDIGALQNLYISLESGQKIPLKEVADIHFEDAPAQISRDNTQRRIVIGVNVRDRDTQSLVEEMQQTLAEKLVLPTGYTISFGGEFKNLQQAKSRLQLVVPLALILIFIMLFISLKSVKQSLLIYSAIPFAAVGGVIALWCRGMPFSISAGVGFIALFGVAVLNGLVLISSLNSLKKEGVINVQERIKNASLSRLRPIFLTAITDIVGFLPMAFSSSSGAEVQRPLATVVIGGLFSATVLTLLVLPVLYQWLESRPQFKSWPKLVIILLLLGLPLSTVAQDTIMSKKVSLEDLQQLAIQQNYGLKADSLDISKSGHLEKTAFNIGNTTVFYGEEEVPMSGNNSSTFGSGVQSFGVSQTIDFPLTYVQRSQMLKQKTVVAQSKYALQTALLKREVGKAYYNWVYAWQKRKFYKQLDSLYASFKEAAELRYTTGETTKLEFLNVSSQYNQLQLEIKATATAYETAQTKIEALTNSIFNNDAYPLTIEHQPIASVDSVKTDMPLLKYREAVVALAKEEVDVQKSQWLPDINLQYTKQTINGNSGFYGFQAGLKIPLFFQQQKGQIKALQAEKYKQEQQLKNDSLIMAKQLKVAFANYLQWSKQLAYYKNTGQGISDELLDGASLSFRVGSIDYIEYTQSLTAVRQIQLNGFKALLEYNLSLVDITYLTSKEK